MESLCAATLLATVSATVIPLLLQASRARLADEAERAVVREMENLLERLDVAQAKSADDVRRIGDALVGDRLAESHPDVRFTAEAEEKDEAAPDLTPVRLTISWKSDSGVERRVDVVDWLPRSEDGR